MSLHITDKLQTNLHKLSYIALCILLLLLFLWDILQGSVVIPTQQVLEILFQGESDNLVWQNILFKIRIPRACTAILAGMALSLAGLLMQTLFKNPLAGPSVLGITSGASIGVALVLLGSGGGLGLATGTWGSIRGEWSLILAASFGAFLVTGLILLISFRVRDNVILLIVGLMIGAFASALVGIWQYFSQADSLQSYVIWTFGSLSGVTPKQLSVLAVLVILASSCSLFLITNLNVLLLGENYARSLGLTIMRTRVVIITLSAILTGGITAFCGPIGFIGIAVPHLTRGLFRTSNHRTLIPGCMLIGSIFMLFCDILTKIPYQAGGLPINIVTSLLGAPLVVLIIMQSRTLKTAF